MMPAPDRLDGRRRLLRLRVGSAARKHLRRGPCRPLLALAMMLGACASAPSSLRLDVQGQIVGSTIRELIVRTYNGGAISEELMVEITLPDVLLLPAATSTGSMLQQRIDKGETTSTLRFTQPVLAPGEVAVVRVPIVNRPGTVTISAWSRRDPRRRVVERRDLVLTR